MTERVDDHERFRVLLGGYVLGGLDATERTDLEQHLRGCADCREELAEIAPAANALTRLRPVDQEIEVPATPTGLRDRVLAGVEAERGRERHRRLVRTVAVTAAAATVAGVAVVAGVRALRPDPGPTSAVPLEQVRVSATRTVHASAALVPHTWGLEVKLHARGFTAGQRYLVVVQSTDGREHEAGEFVGVGDKEMNCNLSSSVLRAQASGFEVLDVEGDVLASGRF